MNIVSLATVASDEVAEVIDDAKKENPRRVIVITERDDGVIRMDNSTMTPIEILGIIEIAKALLLKRCEEGDWPE